MEPKTPEQLIKEFNETPLQFISNKTKPIVVMYLPNHYGDSGWKAETVMTLLNGGYGDLFHPDYTVTDYWTQYYWLCFYNHEIKVPELKVFYDKDFTPINFQELKVFIEEKLKNKP